VKSLLYSVVSQFRAAKSCHWHTMEISAIGKLLSAAVSVGAGLRASKTEFLQQRRRRRNRSIEIQSAICRDKSAYTDNPATSGTFASQEVPTSGPAAQCSRLAADNRLVAGSSPPEPTTHSRARGDFITAWLGVRVLSGPPRSLTRTEIFRLSTNSPAIGGLPYMPLVFELRFIGFEVAVLAALSLPRKITFPGV
jgi:hypothetical protein